MSDSLQYQIEYAEVGGNLEVYAYKITSVEEFEDTILNIDVELVAHATIVGWQEGDLGISKTSYEEHVGGSCADWKGPPMTARDEAMLSIQNQQVDIEISKDERDALTNVSGSDASESMTGSDSSERIAAMAGDDTIVAGAGNDVLDGGAGADALDGGNGFDRASYASASTGVNVHTGDTSQNTGDAAGDSYVSIEAIEGSAFDDLLIFVQDNGRVDAGDGDDEVVMVSGAGTETRIVAGAGNDVIYGGEAKDLVFGGAGNDEAHGYEDADVFDMGEGDDYVQAGWGDDRVFTGAGDDEVYGDDGDDQISTGAGNDLLFGDGGDDQISMGLGDDFVLGGTGIDIFSYEGGYDIIGDFEASTDGERIEIGQSWASDFASLQTFMSEWSGTTYIEFNAQNGIELTGVQIASLNAGDFVFV